MPPVRHTPAEVVVAVVVVVEEEEEEEELPPADRLRALAPEWEVRRSWMPLIESSRPRDSSSHALRLR
jgi:hypothetical protein